MCFHLLYTVQVDTVYPNRSLQLMLVSIFPSWIKEHSRDKRTYSAQVRL